VFAIDLVGGKVLWDLPVKKADELPSLAVSGDTVVVGDKAAYALRDGSKQWSAKDLERGHGCSTGTFSGGPKLVRSISCPTEFDAYGEPETVRYDVSEIDPSSGDVKWTYEGKQEAEADPFGVDDGEILSTSPILAEEAFGSYRILSDSGKPRGTLEIKDKHYLGQSAAFLGGMPSPAIVTAGDTLVVEQDDDGDEYIRAYAMDSGKKLWEKQSSGSEARYDLVQGLDGKVGAIKEGDEFFDPEDADPFSLVTFDPKTGAEEETQDFEGFGESLGTFQAAYVHDGRLFVASVSNEGTLMAADDVGVVDRGHDSSLIAYEI
jgi:hypothetical protein